LKSRIVTLEVEVEDKTKTIEAMKLAIKKLKEKEQGLLQERYCCFVGFFMTVTD
jgi:FtsZ-binding cell division protein ZapB